MCAVIGYYPGINTEGSKERAYQILRNSSIRGLHSFGVFQDGCPPYIGVHQILMNLKNWTGQEPLPVDYHRPFLAHFRYSTSGPPTEKVNNQPLSIGDWVLSFNGVIDMRTKEEMEKMYDINMTTENDGELFIHKYLNKGIWTLKTMPGTFAGVWMYKKNPTYFYAARNAHRPLWRVTYPNSEIWVVSTRHSVRNTGPHVATLIEPYVTQIIS